MKKCILVIFIALLLGGAELFYLDYLVKRVAAIQIQQHNKMTEISGSLLEVTKDVVKNRQVYIYGKAK